MRAKKKKHRLIGSLFDIQLVKNLPAKSVSLCLIDGGRRTNAVGYYKNSFVRQIIMFFKLIFNIFAQRGDDGGIRIFADFFLGTPKRSPAKIGGAGEKFENTHRGIAETGGVTNGGFRIASAARLINIGEIKRQNAVDYIVMVFLKMSQKGELKLF